MSVSSRAASPEWTTIAGTIAIAAGYAKPWTTNFHFHDLLGYYGAIPVSGHRRGDRNRITAGPATRSNEIGLRPFQAFYGDEVGKAVELDMEYAPTPLFGRVGGLLQYAQGLASVQGRMLRGGRRRCG